MSHRMLFRIPKQLNNVTRIMTTPGVVEFTKLNIKNYRTAVAFVGNTQIFSNRSTIWLKSSECNYSASTQCEDPNVATYEEVKCIGQHPEKLLIDVREPEELQETGKIPHSINIPLDKLKSEFTDKNNIKNFKVNYGSLLPKHEDSIILSCRSGSRSQKAVEILRKIGYTNVKNYKGSWLDWAEREGLPK